MGEPIDYASILAAGQGLVPNLRDEALKGLKIDGARQEIDANRRQQENEEEYGIALASLFRPHIRGVSETNGVGGVPATSGIVATPEQQVESNRLESQFPGIVPADQAVSATSAPARGPSMAERLAAMQARYPKHAEALKHAWDTMDKDQRQHRLTTYGGFLARVRNGDFEGAFKIAEPWHIADTEAGEADDVDREIMRILKSGSSMERAHVTGLIASQLSAAVGPDRVGTFWDEVHRDQRESELHPAKLAKAESDAATSEAQAEAAPAYYTGRAEKAASDASTAKTKSLYAEVKEQMGVAVSRARASNIASQIAKRAKQLGKRPDQVSEEDMTGHLGRKRSGAGGLSKGEQDTVDFIGSRHGRPKYAKIAKDAKGNAMGFNPKTQHWERVSP